MAEDTEPVEVSQATKDRIAEEFPWMTPSMVDHYATVQVETGSGAEALQAVRRSDKYQTQFGGNYDPETGEVRLSESNYIGYKRDYDAILVSMDLNPGFFDDEFVNLLENDVAPDEFLGRMEATYERVLSSAPEIRAQYAEYYGIELTDSAIMASVLRPDLTDQILNQQISQAEIGGAAALQGFGIDLDLAERLRTGGVNAQSARDVFQEAAMQLPVLDILNRRHSDPDDPFDLNEFLDAAVFGDADMRRTIRTLVASETSQFGAQGAFTGRTGSLSGLVDR